MRERGWYWCLVSGEDTPRPLFWCEDGDWWSGGDWVDDTDVRVLSERLQPPPCQPDGR